MTLEDVAIIERIVRQSSLDGNDPDEARFDSWLEVDQEQALELIGLIDGRLPCEPLRGMLLGVATHYCPHPGCEVRLGHGIDLCSSHSSWIPDGYTGI